MSQVCRSLRTFVFATVLASGLMLAPAPVQAADICADLDAVIASVEASRRPQHVKDAMIAALEELKLAAGCLAE